MLHTKHLRPFLTVARHGNLARASDELRRAQSAVARSIQVLESSFGVDLFERNARRLLLTDFGRTLCRRVEMAFAELEQARRELCLLHPDAAVRLRTAPFFSLSVHERRLELLFAFASRKHISWVASSVGLSQPAVSMALHDLEAGVGVPLFDRAHSGVALTEAGQLLLARLKSALAELRLAAAEVAALKGVIEGQVLVGALPFARPYMLPVAIGRLLAAHPRLHVRTLEAPLEALIAGLRVGEVDFLVGALPTGQAAEDLVREELGHETLSILMRADHPLARLARPTLEDALERNWVLAQKGRSARDVLDAALVKLGLPQPNVAVESSDLSVIRGLLLETEMITAASRQLFHHELTGRSLVTLPVDLADTARPIGILRRTDAHSSPGAQLLIEELRKIGVGGSPGSTAAQVN